MSAAQILDRLGRLEERAEVVRWLMDNDLELRRRVQDRIPELALQLAEVRVQPEYELAWSEPEPLVSVSIGTFQRTEELIDVAIESVRRQTYPNWEIVVVNDGPNERTRAAIAALGDSRIRFSELPERGNYPTHHPRSRWYVAGIEPMNASIRAAAGRWVARLDDDDEFSPDHIETLLSLARATHAEFAYGALVQHNTHTHEEFLIFSDPPALSAISLQAAIFHRGLSFIDYDPLAWAVGEPGDWNVIRRMMLAGVRHAATEQVVGTLWSRPYLHKAESER